MMRAAMSRDFGWEQSAAKYLNVYRRVVGQTLSRRRCDLQFYFADCRTLIGRRRALPRRPRETDCTAESVTFFGKNSDKFVRLARSSFMAGDRVGVWVGPGCGRESSARRPEKHEELQAQFGTSPVASFVRGAYHGLSIRRGARLRRHLAGQL